eukprot:4394315-Amphidinium_carterae.1
MMCPKTRTLGIPVTVMSRTIVLVIESEQLCVSHVTCLILGSTFGLATETWKLSKPVLAGTQMGEQTDNKHMRLSNT